MDIPSPRVCGLLARSRHVHTHAHTEYNILVPYSYCMRLCLSMYLSILTSSSSGLFANTSGGP